MASFQPSHILVNLSNQCRYNEAGRTAAGVYGSQPVGSVVYLSRDTSYPYSETPMRIADNAFLFNKKHLCRLTLRTLRENAGAGR
ncbi:hypothetical protein M8494_15215 [Serratia ureilytica]